MNYKESFGRPSTEAFEFAKTQGLKVVLPTSNELFVDIDNCEARDTFDKNIDIVAKHIGVSNIISTPSRNADSKPCAQHIVVTLPVKVTGLHRIALQAMLGSDPTRELLSYGRLMERDPNPTLFFEKREE